MDVDAFETDAQKARRTREPAAYRAALAVPTDDSAGLTVSCDPQDLAVSGSYAISQADLNVTSQRRVDDRFDAETADTVYVNCADRAPLHTSGAQ